MSINVKITQYLPSNTVQIAHIGGDIADPKSSVIGTASAINHKINQSPFLKGYSFNVIIDGANGELGLSLSNSLDNQVVITNICSHRRFGQPIPLFYKYSLTDIDITMPVSTDRYNELKAINVNDITAVEQVELNEMEAIIDNAIFDRIYFTDLYNEIASIKFNISKEHIADNNFNITLYLQGSSREIGSYYVIYNDGVEVNKRLINSVPIFNRKAWSKGHIDYGDLS
jgi:hypothetical protein